MTADPIILQMKFADVIALFAQMEGIGLDEALAFFYQSRTCQLISTGASDMHCRSDEYLAEDLQTEYRNYLQTQPASQ